MEQSRDTVEETMWDKRNGGYISQSLSYCLVLLFSDPSQQKWVDDASEEQAMFAVAKGEHKISFLSWSLQRSITSFNLTLMVLGDMMWSHLYPNYDNKILGI